MDSISTREAYGNALAEYGIDERIVVLDADLSKSTKTELFKKKYPERFFNMGIAEANMMSVAAGFASCGKIVFASTFAMFASGRAFEQVRNSICYPRLNVKIGASHAGITVGEDGASHQTIEDIAIMSAIPNMVVINPADGIETKSAVKAIIDYDGPVYLRLSRPNSPIIFNENNYDFALGKGITVTDGKDVTIVSTGPMLSIALEASNILKNEGISARVINIHTLKPIDKDLLIKCALETRAILTVEEHSIIGGLGSIVSSVLSKYHPTPLRMVGIEDEFGKSGKPDELLKMYGLTTENIIVKIKEIINFKK